MKYYNTSVIRKEKKNKINKNERKEEKIMENMDIKKFLNVEINDDNYDDYVEMISNDLLKDVGNITDDEFVKNLDEKFSDNQDGTYGCDITSWYIPASDCSCYSAMIAYPFANGYIVISFETAY